MEEQMAIDRLRRGDVGGLEVLVRLYQVRAVRAAYLVTHDVALAQDVVQAAFVKAYERIEQFQAGRPFGPWFLRCVLNDAIKAARRRGRLTSLDALEQHTADLSVLADTRAGPAELWEQAEIAAEVRAALLSLTPHQRAAVVARYFLGWSEARMSAALTCPPSTVKWRLHAARARLRLLLRPLNNE